MPKTPKRIELLLADLLHDFAFELDSNYENPVMAALLAEEDSTVMVYRRALRELRRRKVPLSSRILHVERRLKDSYYELFGERLPKLDEKEGSDKIW